MALPIKVGHWYQKWWGVILIALIGIFLATAVFFLIITLKYWWQIKQGGALFLEQQFYGNFSRVSQQNLSQNKIKREEIETSDDPYLGNPNAKLVIVEFVDYLCPNCQKADPIVQQLISQYGYKTKVIIRDFPADSLHPGASALAELAYCSHSQGQFWKMHDYLLENQSDFSIGLNATNIKKAADYIGADYNILINCYNSGKAKIEVNQDYADALRFGISGTPTFFVNGQKVEGVVPFSTWEKVID